MHKIAKIIRGCNARCFSERYEDITFKGKVLSKEMIESIRPLVWAPKNPRYYLLVKLHPYKLGSMDIKIPLKMVG